MKKKKRAPKTASLLHERQYTAAGYRVIVGIDEVGRGPLAGPVAAGAVALPLNREDLPTILRGVRDSKEMNALQRLAAAATIKDIALSWGIGHSTSREIDANGIVAATKLAMQRALDNAVDSSGISPDCAFLDQMPWPQHQACQHAYFVHGDKLSLSIASASVIAKVWRDNFMMQLDELLPQYGFAQNKGYGTASHLRALEQYGPCEYHRRAFKPVQDALRSLAQ